MNTPPNETPIRDDATQTPPGVVRQQYVAHFNDAVQTPPGEVLAQHAAHAEAIINELLQILQQNHVGRALFDEEQ